VQGRAVKPTLSAQAQTAQRHIVHVQPGVALAQGLGAQQGDIGPGLFLDLVCGAQGCCLLRLGQVQIAGFLQTQCDRVVGQAQVLLGLAQKSDAELAQPDIDRACELLADRAGRQ